MLKMINLLGMCLDSNVEDNSHTVVMLNGINTTYIEADPRNDLEDAPHINGEDEICNNCVALDVCMSLNVVVVSHASSHSHICVRPQLYLSTMLTI